MEQLKRRVNAKYLVLLYGGFALLAYTMSLGESFSLSLRPVPWAMACGMERQCTRRTERHLGRNKCRGSTGD